MTRLHSRMASRIELWPIDRLRPYAKNPRTHSPEQVAQIAASITEFGFNNPILVDSTDGIIAGHGRLLAAQQLGMTEVPAVVLDHLTDAQRRAYIIADNQLALNAGWDTDLLVDELASLLDEDFDVGVIGFSDDELASLLDDDEVFECNTDADEVPEPPEVAVSATGDLWCLGDHRLLCGDATNADDLTRLMAGKQADLIFTDPPYGISYGTSKNPRWRSRAIANDSLTGDEFRQFCHRWISNVIPYCDDCIYVFGPPGPDGRIMFGVLDELLHCSTTVIWNKDRFTLGRGKYQNKYEPLWFGWSKTGESFTSDRTLSNVWDFPRPSRSDLHPTMKPVALIEYGLSHASKRGDIVLDPFGGSGSTLIACEQVGRVARLLELEPRYIDVIIRRWQEFTGREAILDGDGRTFAEIEQERA